MIATHIPILNTYKIAFSVIAHLLAFVGLFAGSVYHDLMPAIIGDAGKVFVAFVASVQNTRFLVHGGFVPLQIVTALQILIANLANKGFDGARVGSLLEIKSSLRGCFIIRLEFIHSPLRQLYRRLNDKIVLI